MTNPPSSRTSRSPSVASPRRAGRYPRRSSREQASRAAPSPPRASPRAPPAVTHWHRRRRRRRSGGECGAAAPPRRPARPPRAPPRLLRGDPEEERLGKLPTQGFLPQATVQAGKPGDPDPSAGKSGAASESTAGKSSESASSSGGGGGAGGSSGGGEGPKTIGDLLSSPVAAQALATAALTAILAALWQSGGDAREISFQEFKNTLLEQGLVDRVEVSNKTQAKVYVRSSPIAPGASGSRGATSPPAPIPPSSSTTSTSGPWTRSSVSWKRRRTFWAWTRTSSFR